MTVVELLAYAADYLSYYQDAGPGTEGYLDTCLHRIFGGAAWAAYRLPDGAGPQCRNAFVHLEGGAGANGMVPAGTKVTSLVAVPLQGAAAPPGPIMPALADFDRIRHLPTRWSSRLKSDTRVLEIHNELRIHTWGDRLCCLSRDARELFLYRDNAGTAVRPDLRQASICCSKKSAAPRPGSPPTPIPKHRQVLLIGSVEATEDRGVHLGGRRRHSDTAYQSRRSGRCRCCGDLRQGRALKFAPCISAETVDHRASNR